MNDDCSSPTTKSKTVWSLGSYKEIALFLLPVSAHLVKLCNISPHECVLDVACGTGNSTITARRQGAKVNLDITPEMLAQAKEEASLAEVGAIDWKEGDVQDLPFDDESFDVVLSSFGHMFAPYPEVAIQEMLRVTKKGGQIAFATWPPELANGRLFEAMAKYIPYWSDAPSPSQHHLPSPMLWGSPEVIQERLGNSVQKIHYERGAVNKPVLSTNHWWKMSSTKSGSLVQAIQILKDSQKIESLRNDVLQAITPYIQDNVLRLDYLITLARKV